ncbi:MAG: glycosyltransferase family 4 protein [Planctomycetota bacterium]|nr:glycosyltransferase family 4 protein [Planctomycetota bacterium]
MRVAMLLLNAGRGSGEVARQHARFLVSQGAEVYFMHPFVGEGVPDAVNLDIELHTNVVPVHENLPSAGENQKTVAHMTREEAFAYLPAYEQALEAVIDHVDIVLGHHANLSAIATAAVARRAGKPYALFVHGTGIEPRHAGLFDDEVWGQIESAIHGADGLLVTTEYVRDELVRKIVDVPEDRFLVLPCGIDLDEFHPDRTGDVVERYGLREPFVICPGALTQSKGPQNVVAASTHYADLAQTVFIGGGELLPQLEADLGDRGRVLGFVPAADKAALINAATLLTAAPQKKEHFGIIYAEALAGGTPPVAYEGGGVGSIITPATGALTVRSPEALGGALRELLLDPERIARMGQAARERAEATFSNITLGAQLEAWLGELIAGRSTLAS